MLFDGASLVSFQGRVTAILEYLSPHDLDFQVVDLDLSRLNPKDPAAAKPVLVFDRQPLDFCISRPKGALPPGRVDSLAVSQRVAQFLNSWLRQSPAQAPTGNCIRVSSARFIRTVARPSPNWAAQIDSTSEDLHLFKAVALYMLEYLFKTRAGGYFLALSGGSDSTLSALFVCFACQSLAFYAYQDWNFEILDKISYVTGLPVSLRKATLSAEARAEALWLSGADVRAHPGRFALARGAGAVADSDALQYFLGEGEVLCAQALCRRLLTAAYLPMDFSGETKPFVDKLRERLEFSFVECSIQGAFDAFKGEMEGVLAKWADQARRAERGAGGAALQDGRRGLALGPGAPEPAGAQPAGGLVHGGAVAEREGAVGEVPAGGGQRELLRGQPRLLHQVRQLFGRHQLHRRPVQARRLQGHSLLRARGRALLPVEGRQARRPPGLRLSGGAAAEQAHGRAAPEGGPAGRCADQPRATSRKWAFRTRTWTSC